MSEPRYRGIVSGDIPVVTDDGGAIVRIVAGRIGSVEGPVRDVVTKPEYLDVTVPAGKTFTHRTPREHTVFAYVFEGSGWFGHDREAGDRHLVSFGPGDVVSIRAQPSPVRFLLGSERPISEPICRP